MEKEKPIEEKDLNIGCPHCSTACLRRDYEMIKDYSININWSDEDSSYLATVNEFPNLLDFGNTKKEALKEAEIALSGYIRTLEEEGEPI